MLSDLFSRLDDLWRAQGAPIADEMSDGIPASEVYRQLDAVGLRPSAEVVSWYGWHNGARPGAPFDGAETHTVLELLSVEGALQNREFRQSIAQQVTESAEQAEMLWSPTWLPLCAFEGTSLVADLNGDTTDQSPIYYVARDDSVQSATRSADSLEDLMQAWVFLLEHHLARWDSERRIWVRDFERMPPEFRERAIG